MALRIRKKSADTSCKSTGASRNSSPTYSLIKQSLISGLKEFTKDSRTRFLHKPELKNFLIKLNFLKEPEEDSNIDFAYMWKLINKNSLVHISDAFAYILCILDIEIPKSIISSSVVFKELNSDFSFIKLNSSGFVKNYLENLYAKSKESNFALANDFVKTKTPKSRDLPGKGQGLRRERENVEKRKSLKEARPKSALRTGAVRLKRSASNSRSHSKEMAGILITTDSNKKHPVIGIDISSTRNKARGGKETRTTIIYVNI